jgi:hypothetical protein
MNKFTIHYPNGMKRHVKKAEIILLGSSLQQISRHEYRAASFQQNIEQESGPSFLSGLFIIEYPRRLGGKKYTERMQSVQGMVRQFERNGTLQVTA